MNTADQLIAGYTAYTDAGELAAGATGEAPRSLVSFSITATTLTPQTTWTMSGGAH